MMLLISSFVASLDGFIIGIGLKGNRIQLKWKEFIILFVENIFLYSFLLFLYSFFHFQFITPFISTLLYLVLAFFSFRNKEEDIPIVSKNLNVFSCFFLTLTHSLDGVLVSLGFVYEYPLFVIIILFSFMAIFLIGLGYFFAKSFPMSKKSNYISTVLFLFLAIWNQFF